MNLHLMNSFRINISNMSQILMKRSSPLDSFWLFSNITTSPCVSSKVQTRFHHRARLYQTLAGDKAQTRSKKK